MLSRPKYISEILSWADQEGIEWTREQAGTAFFDTIVLKAGSQFELTILAVSLESWLDSKMQYFDHLQNTMRLHRNAGKQCMVLWQDYWERNGALAQSRFRAMLHKSQTLPGRLTQARRIDQATAGTFLNENHLNGATGAKFKFGLFLPKRYFRVLNTTFLPKQEDELLVAVATFSNARTFIKNDRPYKSYELIRFANLAGMNVIGGLDKLLHAFAAEREPDDIMTYADLEWSVGRSYEKLGFEPVGILEPEQFYLNIENLERTHSGRINTVKPDLILVQNMGSVKFVKNINVQ